MLIFESASINQTSSRFIHTVCYKVYEKRNILKVIIFSSNFGFEGRNI